MKKISVFCFLVLLGGCASYVDARREAGQVATVGASRPNAPVVCSAMWVDAQDRLSMAQKECDKLKKQAVSTEIDVFACSLFAPVKETFSCIDEK